MGERMVREEEGTQHTHTQVYNPSPQNTKEKEKQRSNQQ
jgi:hypothetical protein